MPGYVTIPVQDRYCFHLALLKHFNHYHAFAIGRGVVRVNYYAAFWNFLLGAMQDYENRWARTHIGYEVIPGIVCGDTVMETITDFNDWIHNAAPGDFLEAAVIADLAVMDVGLHHGQQPFQIPKLNLIWNDLIMIRINPPSPAIVVQDEARLYGSAFYHNPFQFVHLRNNPPCDAEMNTFKRHRFDKREL